MISGVLTPPPYALSGTEFPFRALALLAGRAPLGGAREAAMATLLAARMAEGMVAPLHLPSAARRLRAEAAKHWLSSVSLGGPVRAAVSRVFEISATEDPGLAAMAIGRVTEVTAPHLDRGARLELERLVARLRS